MASIRKRPDNGLLFIDVRINGQRCREQTALPDTPANRKRLQKLLERMEADQQAGTFDYAKYFPGSRMALKLAVQQAVSPVAESGAVPSTAMVLAAAAYRPSFKDFASTWVEENAVAWRRSHRRTVDDILNGHLLPAFGEKAVDGITKQDILAFRSSLAKVRGRKADTLSPKRINAIMAPLRQILNEAADRFEFNTPFRNIKPLKVPRSDVEPFTLEEMQSILNAVRKDYRNYYTVRFLTGTRTGEIDGLKWQYVDFEHRLILVRETIVCGEEDTTKTESSQRDIQMSQRVYDALQEQAKVTRGKSVYVFCTSEGKPLDHNNVTKRVWYPLLRYLGLKERRPYQTRHTAATLWLASGENPLWIAQQLGHASTEMLFKVYGRFVPNLTRQDGSAFERLLRQSGAYAAPTSPEPTESAATMAATATQENQHE